VFRLTENFRLVKDFARHSEKLVTTADHFIVLHELVRDPNCSEPNREALHDW
jgi:hypothetical protein